MWNFTGYVVVVVVIVFLVPPEKEEVDRAERAIQLMGASLLQIRCVDSHSKHGQRTAIICLKGKPTPKKYPRDPGTPAKIPL